jgi:hypothetical protein
MNRLPKHGRFPALRRIAAEDRSDDGNLAIDYGPGAPARAGRSRPSCAFGFASFPSWRLCVSKSVFHLPAAPKHCEGGCASVAPTPHPMTRPPTNPKLKSTLPLPESTVDLGCEALIRVENRLVPSPVRGHWRAFCPMMTWQSRGCDQNQTGTGRKKIFARVDSGCEDFSAFALWSAAAARSSPQMLRIPAR